MNTYKVFFTKTFYLLSKANNEQEIVLGFMNQGTALPLAIELVEVA